MRALSSHVALGVMVAALAGLVAACGDDGNKEPDGINAAWVYISQPGDLGWTYAHDQGRLQVELQVEGATTTYRDSVAETAEALAPVIDELVEDNQIIFTTSFGYMDPTETAAGQYPDVYFEHCSGFKTAENMANYFGRMYQARYLTGIVAGRMVPDGAQIGFVAAFPIPEVIRGINAFTLGVRSVNPTATVEVNWTCTWFDPALEATAADELLAGGCELLAQHQDSTATAERAAAAGKYAIGYDSDTLSFVPDAILTSAIWNWGAYYTRRVQEAKDGTWSSGSYWGSMADGIVGLGEYNDAVSQAIRDEVAAAQDDIVSGASDVFDGPINKQDGSELVADGASMSDGDMLGMMDFVEGVVGTTVACE